MSITRLLKVNLKFDKRYENLKPLPLIFIVKALNFQFKVYLYLKFKVYEVYAWLKHFSDVSLPLKWKAMFNQKVYCFII